jgi:hypothetical protein
MNIEVISWKFASESAFVRGSVANNIAFHRILIVCLQDSQAQLEGESEVEWAAHWAVDDR